MALTLQRIFNCFALALMVVSAGALLLSNTRLLPPNFMLLATVPLVLQLVARAPSASSGLRIAAMPANWVAAVLVGSLAAVALTGIGDTSALTPMLVSAAALYVWNAVSLAMTPL